MVFEIWKGGMSFHGGLLGVVVAVIGYALANKIDLYKLGDLIAPAAPIGLFFGRIANFVNGELWGRQTDLPWGIIFPQAGGYPRHPSQIYEALLEGLVLFVLLRIATHRFGWLQKRGLLDFAGGTVVHLNAGVAALVCALVLGRRRGFPETAMPPHNMTMAVTGAAMLWVGWFGFNAGSALAADGAAGMAMLVTHVGAATGAFAWMVCEWLRYGKPSALGIATGMVAGLGTITPASGFVGPIGALIIGAAAGVACFFATNFMKRGLNIDDSLDVFPVHGVGGLLGTLLTGIFVSSTFGGIGYADKVTMGEQFVTQIVGVLAVGIWSGVLTWILLKLLDVVVGMRVAGEEETEGLDTVLHNEKGYNL